ncbi:hypothetical protein [Sorangium sp. So ce1151]|uniref:hypothetical protein n=1 Tax=Sorangium sp. So ce1151 TaxID=3133332 RepID=UPI003F629008
MLGSVALRVQALGAGGESIDPEGEEKRLRRVEDELPRARHFRRPFALLHVRMGAVAFRTQMAAVAHHAGESSPCTHGTCIGLCTGQVLSGSVRSQAYGRLDYTVLGEAVNAAAHLARAALPGEVLVDATVREAVVQHTRLDSRRAESALISTIDDTDRG